MLLTGAITFLATTALWVAVILGTGIISAVTNTFSTTAEDYFSDPFRVSVASTPTDVGVGETFTIDALVEPMEADMEHRMTHIDVSSELLTFLELVEVTPAIRDRFELIYGYRRFRFREPVTISETHTQEVSLTFRAKSPGNAYGDLDFTTPSEMFTTLSLDLTIVDPTSASSKADNK